MFYILPSITISLTCSYYSYCPHKHPTSWNFPISWSQSLLFIKHRWKMSWEETWDVLGVLVSMKKNIWEGHLNSLTFSQLDLNIDQDQRNLIITFWSILCLAQFQKYPWTPTNVPFHFHKPKHLCRNLLLCKHWP